ncbi:uncharacterized protein LOC125673566 [Ostrea edulis]|uniref:uncharacterized protein LOC125673566 n=1 Tax=Ostrea edulis TaxID=37623 RepID=UPI0024AFD6B4|nr:uncharacterized protein LOC125673566 [Ostrea edulis]
MTKTLTLTSGDPTHCTKTKIMRKSCRKSCQYKPGKWGQCNPSTGLVERQDRLKPNSAKFCAQYRMLTKKCKKIKKRNSCKYKIGQWGPCDPASKKRTKVLTLIKGNANKCKPVKEIQRLCIRPDGSDRCFFGQWKAWEGCQNGVQKRQREVLQGGEDCQIRAVRVQPC